MQSSQKRRCPDSGRQTDDDAAVEVEVLRGLVTLRGDRDHPVLIPRSSTARGCDMPTLQAERFAGPEVSIEGEQHCRRCEHSLLS